MDTSNDTPSRTDLGEESGTDGSAVRTEKLTREFNGTRAVTGLDLRVPRGEVYGFLGPNGAGKTTTLRMLVGLLEPTRGAALVAGEEVRPGETSLALRRKVGYLPEDPAFYAWMTAEELLVMVGRVFGLTPTDALSRSRELLGVVDLSRDKDRRIRTFSRGMRQRLGIAQALVGRPEVLILDEPASALDPVGRKDVLDLIASLKGDSTILVSSHILDDVERIAGWVGVIDGGRLLAEAPLHELLERYARPVFRVEVKEDKEVLAGALQAESWVRNVVEEGGGLRVLATDPMAAQMRIPALIAGRKMHLTEFRTLLPTLEDVFLQLIGSEQRGNGDARIPSGDARIPSGDARIRSEGDSIE